jgi:hypothetical protein
MIFLSQTNQKTLHTLWHMPNGMPIARGGQGQGMTGKSNRQLLETKLIEQFRGPDAGQWIRLTPAGRAFVQAVGGR